MATATTTLNTHTVPPMVATDLDCREGLPSGADDVIIEGKCYRRLSPDYYAWLRSQMERARHQHDAGIIPAAHYETLRQRFNAMHDRAVALFGEETLLQTLQTFSPTTYPVPSVRQAARIDVLLHDAVSAYEHTDAAATARDPLAGTRVRMHSGRWQGWIVCSHPADEWFPNGWADIVTDEHHTGQADLRGLVDEHGMPLIPHPRYTEYEQRAIALAREEKPEDFDDLEASLPILAFPVPGTWRFEEEPSLDDFLKVNDIRERAHELGWMDADLFQTCGRFQFPCGQDYGLVCFLRGRTIGEITAETIALHHDQPGGAVLTFTRPHRTPAPEEVSDGTIRQALPERGATPAQAAAGGVTKLRRRSDAVCPISDHPARVQPPESAGPAHAGIHAHRHRPSAGHESAKRVPDSQSRQTTSAEHPCLVF